MTMATSLNDITVNVEFSERDILLANAKAFEDLANALERQSNLTQGQIVESIRRMVEGLRDVASLKKAD